MPVNKSDITIIGSQKVIKALKRMSEESKKGRLIKAAARKSHKPILDATRKNYKALGLKATGEPSNDMWDQRTYKLIKTKTIGRGADSGAITGIVGREAAKAYWIEYGTTRKNRGTVEPRPFFRPAVIKEGEPSLSIMEKEMWEAIENEWDRMP